MHSSWQATPPTPPPSTNTKRRRRTQIACVICRDRKTRCNGEKPACSSCVRRGVEHSCVYEDDLSTPRNSVVKRWVPPEQPLTYHSGSKPTWSNSPSPPKLNRWHSATSTESAPTAIGSPRNSDVPIYGGSSASALLSQIKVAISRSDTSTNPLAHSEPVGNRYGEALRANRPEVVHEQDVSKFVLPSRDTGDNLLRSYWHFSHPVFPILHRPTFMAQYQKLWEPSGTAGGPEDEDNCNARTLLYIKLNAVFAIACQFTTVVNPSARSAYGNEFYQRSRKLVNFEILDGVQIATIEYLLLHAVYLYYEQPTEYADRCWNVVGLAIRAAQGLGLHMKETPSTQVGQLEREIRRRIWHCAVILDRLLGMTHGRPTMVPASWKVELPSMIDDEYLMEAGEGVQPIGLPSQMSLFVYTIRLFDILEEVLAIFYSAQCNLFFEDETRLGSQASEAFSEVLRLEAKLNQFNSEIPRFLRAENLFESQDRPWYIHVVMQSSILRNRYLYTRILLFRPILIASVMINTLRGRDIDMNESLLEDSIVSRTCSLCILSAQALVENLWETRNTKERTHVHAWHGVYYAFAAALILIAGHMCPLVTGDFHDLAFNTAWSRCILILQSHAEQMPSCERARAFLEALKTKVCHDADTMGDILSANEDDTIPMTTTAPAHGLYDVDATHGMHKDKRQQSNAINDIFGDYDVWDLGITGLSDLAWPSQRG